MKILITLIMSILVLSCRDSENKTISPNPRPPTAIRNETCHLKWSNKEFILYYNTLIKIWKNLEFIWIKNEDVEKNKIEFLILSSKAMVIALPDGVPNNDFSDNFEYLFHQLIDTESFKVKSINETELIQINNCQTKENESENY